MEPPISLDGEDIRNEKVFLHVILACNAYSFYFFWWEASFQAKLLRSVRKLEPSDVILGQYKARAGDKVDVYMNSLTPTYFAAALYIDNARWDGVPFLIKTGMGLIKHRLDILD